MAPAARVVVDDDAWNADLAAATASGRLQLTNWRGRVQRDGLPIDQLLACGTAGADATSLAGCAKTRIPWPDGPWGAVFSFDIDNHGPFLAVVARGLRHPPPTSARPTVYQRAHRRLHAGN